MLLQRLVDSETRGFGFDYMGASEYENGATTNGMAALARLFLEGRLVARKTGFGEIHRRMRGEYVTVLAIGSAETLDRLGDPMDIRVTHEPFHAHRARITAWMAVDMDRAMLEPLMLVRIEAPDEQIMERVSLFLKDAIEYEKGASANER